MPSQSTINARTIQLIPIGVTQPKLTVNSTTAATARATRCSRTSMVVLTRGRISCGTGT